MDAGSALHNALEYYYTHKSDKDFNKDAMRNVFINEWKAKKLDETKLRFKFDEFMLMVLNGMNKNYNISSVEFKIFFEDVVGYLDGIDTYNDVIYDWKTSTRTKDTDEEYIKQLKFYAWLYFRKFGRVPKQCTVVYVKYDYEKSELTIYPTRQDVNDTELWFTNTLAQMESMKEEPKECNAAYPYHLYNDSTKFTLNILGNVIHVEGIIDSLLHKGLDKKFSYELKDSFFIKKHNPMINTTIRFWDKKRQTIPIGFMDGLMKTLTDYGEFKGLKLEIKVEDLRNFYNNDSLMPEKFVNNKELRSYQIDAVNNFLRKKIAVLEIGTGGGKTEIAIECIRRLRQRTLFIVDKIELLKQTKKRIEESLGITVGVIGQGEINTQEVTVATIQTLLKKKTELSFYLKTVRFAIFDECHKVAASSYWKISHLLPNTEYRMGISGTAFRDDGNDMYINAICGSRCFELNSKTLIENGWLMMPKIYFIEDFMDEKEVREQKLKTKVGDVNESAVYADYYQHFISENWQRNTMLMNVAAYFKDKKILVLTKLISHGEHLANVLSGKHLHGSTSKEERAVMLEEFTKGKLNVLVSTISIFSEGIDIPNLDMVVNAAANKGDVKTIQILGRVLRMLQGKKNAYYIDFIDYEKFFESASNARKKALKLEGHTIHVVDFDNFVEQLKE